MSSLADKHHILEAEVGRVLVTGGWRVMRESYEYEPWDMEVEDPSGRVVHLQFKTRTFGNETSPDVTLGLKQPSKYDEFVDAGNVLLVVTDHMRWADWNDIRDRSNSSMWTRMVRDDYWFLRDTTWQELGTLI